jgi:hypothetical protein
VSIEGDDRVYGNQLGGHSRNAKSRTSAVTQSASFVRVPKSALFVFDSALDQLIERIVVNEVIRHGDGRVDIFFFTDSKEICVPLYPKSHVDKHEQSAKDNLCCDWLKHDFVSGAPTKN